MFSTTSIALNMHTCHLTTHITSLIFLNKEVSDSILVAGAREVVQGATTLRECISVILLDSIYNVVLSIYAYYLDNFCDIAFVTN